MRDEFNSSASEFAKEPKETTFVFEGKTTTEAGIVRENSENYSNESNVSNKPTQKNKKSTKSKNSLLVSMASSFAAVAVVATTALGGGLPSSKVSAEIAEYWATDTSIMYQVNFQDVEDELTIVVYNDFTRQVSVITGEELLEGSYFGVCEDLKPNVQYTIAVQTSSLLGNKTIAKQKLSTMKTEDMPKTEFYSVDYESKMDGYFYFTMNYIDENGYWFEYAATLTDTSGNVATCEFGPPQHEQRIRTVDEYDSNRTLVGSTAIFTITCMSTENNEFKEIILYTAEVNIY